MKLKFDYHRPVGGRVAVAVTTDSAATVGDVAAELMEADPLRSPAPDGRLTLAVAAPGREDFRQLDPDRAIGESPLSSGWAVRVQPHAEDRGGEAARPRVEVTVVRGPERDKRFALPNGSYTIGRDSSCDIVLTDRLASRRHARLDVGGLVELVDLKSANGLEVDGGLIDRLSIYSTQQFTIGDTELRVEVLRATGQDATASTTPVVPFNRSPRVEPRYPGTEFAAPDVPHEGDKPPFPWMLIIIPVLMGGVSFAVSKGNPTSLVFLAMSPLMMAANYVMGRQRSGKQRDTQIGIFQTQLADLRADFEQETATERQTRLWEAPSASQVVEAIETRSPLLWTRRPEHWSFLNVRFGLGTVESRNSVAGRGPSRGIPRFADELDEFIDSHRTIDGVPVVENPISAGALGAVGPTPLVASVARSLLLQWAGLHSPAEVVLTAMVGPDEVGEFDWLKWLPHTTSPSSPLTVSHLADSATSTGALLAQLEDVVSARSGSRPSTAARRAAKGAPAAMSAGALVGDDRAPDIAVPVIVLLVTGSAPVDRARLAQLVESAADASVVVLHLAERVADLPAACRTFVDVGDGLDSGSVSFVRHSTVVRPVRVEGVDVRDATTAAISLAPYYDQGAVVEDASDLPQTVPLLALLGADVAGTPAAVIDRWRQTESLVESPARPRRRTSGLRAMVGSTGAGELHLDLRTQGPHALVGGTTGAGKSEFLQAWVLGMAAEYSPQRVTFLFVDYKGGSAFAECVDLPHSVGIVTDLTPHLVLRALTSLRAELRHREEVLASKKAKDLLELEKRGDPDCPPALVIVIDEFAALANEVPEFVDGVVDVAQRGRSLGIHLIMATQRPAGVIRDNLRANTNLRVALRMADESDSRDVLESPEAASFDPATPGRAVAKTGPGRLTPFQSAFAGGRSNSAPVKATIVVSELRFGTEQVWERPPAPEAGPVVELGPTDLVTLVGTVTEAASLLSLPVPRRPWLNELQTTYDLAALAPRSDARLVLGMADLPAAQQQRAIAFEPDTDGHLIVYGTGGSGKTVLLRTLAAGSAVTPRGGPVQVYGLDFAAGGLRMLDVLPHVGAVISGDDDDRVARLFRMLRAELERRSRAYSAANADSIVAYRATPGTPDDEPRILVLLDGYPAFRTEFEAVPAKAASYAVFQQVLAEGRQLGIHLVLTADRPGSVPGAVSSSIPRRVVLRLAEDTMYGALDVPNDVLTPTSPAGRAIIDDVEVQIAVLGGSTSAHDQSRALEGLGRAVARTGRARTPQIATLPPLFGGYELPDEVGGEPVLGVADTTLEPTGFAAEGVLLISGPPGSGRSNALVALTDAVTRWRPTTARYFIAGRRSDLASRADWTSVAVGPEEGARLAKELADGLDYVSDGNPVALIVVEAIADLLGTSADGPLAELVKASRRTGHLLIAENETSGWSGGWGAAALTEVKAARRGVLLQPDQIDGDNLLRTALPRIGRDEYPPGRGLYVNRGKTTKVQLPFLGG